MTQQQQLIVDAFNSEIYVQNRMDVQHTPIYDTVTVAAAAVVNETTSAFFTNVGPASAKTLALTNMSQSQRLPAPEAFSIFGFRLRWSETLFITDALAILNSMALEFWLGQKVYQRAPLWYFSPGGGLNAVTTVTDHEYLSNGAVTRESMHKLAIPIVIENQMTFFARLVGNPVTLTAAAAGGTGLTVQLLLDGFHARGVQ